MAKLDLKKFLDRVELKSKFNFESFTGFALEDSEKGTAKMGFQFNVNDSFESDLKNTLIQGILDNFVYPEIMHRVHNGKLLPSYKPTLIHMLLNSRSSKNKILLGNETNFQGNYVLKKDRDFKPGEDIKLEEIKEITKIFPRDNYMGDSAHIMLLKFKNKWLCCIDLVFDRLKIKRKMRSAQEFLDSAEHNLEKKQWSPFATSIWRATELAALSLLLIRFQGDFSIHQDHVETRKRFKALCKMKNISSRFGDHFDSIYELYKTAAYAQGIKRDFKLDESQAQEFVATTRELIAYVNQVLEIINQNRKSSGEKIIEFRS